MMGSDRINFFTGYGEASFKLTPFLLLSALFLFSYYTNRLITFRTLSFKRSLLTSGYLWLTFMLLVICVATALRSQDVLGIKRLLLLAYQMLFAFSFAAYVMQLSKQEREKVIVLGAQLGVLIYSFLNLLQVDYFFGILWGKELLSNLSFLDVMPSVYGDFAVRLSGGTLDPNRAGLILICYAALILVFSSKDKKSALILFLIAFQLLLTFSRSAYLAGIIFIFLSHRHLLRSKSAMVAMVFSVSLFVGFVLFLSNMDIGLDVQKIIDDRFSFSEHNSTGEHFRLFAKAIEIATSNYMNLVIGIGFGNSYQYLPDFFGGSKYGNFHSIYLTMLVETGIGGLMVVMLIMGIPGVKNLLFRPIIGALIGFNLFYQLQLEPFFWFVLALAWLIPTEIKPLSLCFAESRRIENL